jgi:CBS domain-containing protein
MLGDELEHVNEALKLAYGDSVGVLDKDFLCQSLGALSPHAPLCVRELDTLAFSLEQIRAHRVGCLMIVNEDGRLSGIFSERDFVLKVADSYEQVKHRPIVEFMTPNPVAEQMDCTVAFALNLMSHGGFRHLPIVDQDGRPVGAISVKDVVDYIVQSFTQDLLDFDTTST